MSGKLTDGHAFHFLLDRSGTSARDLEKSLDASFKDFQSSLTPDALPDPQSTTTFRYPVDERASDAIAQGASALAFCGPYVAAFNPEFRSIRFLTDDSATTIQLKNRRLLADHLEEVEVEVSGGDIASPDSRSYVVAELDRVAVAVPFARQNESVKLTSAAGMSKLMLGFPRLGRRTSASRPSSIASVFRPPKNGTGVYLGQNDDPVNRENEAVLEQSCRLLLSIVEFAAGLAGPAPTYLPNCRPFTRQSG